MNSHQRPATSNQQPATSNQQPATSNQRPPCQVCLLGLVSYSDGLDLQAALVQARQENHIPDALLLLEHPPTITLGRGADPTHILADPATLAAHGIEVFQTNRGGQATYHGPGQLVAYPVIDLKPDRCDAHRYLRDLEEVVIRTLRDVGLRAHRISGLTGVWVGQEKIAAIGVHLSRWVTSHGLALNVHTDVSAFHLIIPCGLGHECYGVTSIQKTLGRPVDMRVIQQRLTHHFSEIFCREMVVVPPPQESVQVIVMTDQGPEPEFLLLKRTPARGGFWQPVTGRMESGETPPEAAARELEEETGLRGRPLSLHLTQSFLLPSWLSERPPRQPLLNREYSFVMKIRKQPVRLNPEEHTTARWVSLLQALNWVRWESARRALTRAAQSATGDGG